MGWDARVYLAKKRISKAVAAKTYAEMPTKTRSMMSSDASSYVYVAREATYPHVAADIERIFATARAPRNDEQAPVHHPSI